MSAESEPGPVEPASAVVVGEDGLARPAWAAVDPMLREYYDTEWGMPVRDERGVFERLSLEAFQSGLSWATILRKRAAFRRAFADFSPDVVAAFGRADVERLVVDARIIRNRAKIVATIGNARATVAMRAASFRRGGGEATDEPRDLADLVWSFAPASAPQPRVHEEIPTTSPESVALAKELRQRGFRFVGPTMAFALMAAIGVVDIRLVGSHPPRRHPGITSGSGDGVPHRG